jgi:cyclo(L-tyrosyl-L-tyrosyl) synthase
MNAKLTPTIIPLNSASQAVFDKRDHVLIGVSPFNSYFSSECIKTLLEWGFETFKKVHIFIPDGISIHTLRGLGYTDDHAARKVRKNDAQIKCRVINALRQFNPDVNDHIIQMSDALCHEKYLTIYQEILKKFENNKKFRQICLGTSEKMLSNYQKECNAALAVPYLLYELPFYFNTPFILDVPSSVTIYHYIPDFLPPFYENGLISNNSGFIQVIT